MSGMALPAHRTWRPHNANDAADQSWQARPPPGIPMTGQPRPGYLDYCNKMVLYKGRLYDDFGGLHNFNQWREYWAAHYNVDVNARLPLGQKLCVCVVVICSSSSSSTGRVCFI